MKPLTLLLCIFLALLSTAPLNAFPGVVSASGSSFPIAAFTYNPCVLCAVPGDLVSFQGNWSLATSGTIFNASDSVSYESGTNPITGYAWNFGDGGAGSGRVVTHSYSASGSYRIVLTLQTASGNPSISKTLVVGQIGSVGGQSLMIDKLGLLLPYVALASIIVAAYLGGLYMVRRKR